MLLQRAILCQTKSQNTENCSAMDNLSKKHGLNVHQFFLKTLKRGFLTGGPQEHFEVGHRVIWKIVKLVKIYSLVNFTVAHLCVFYCVD